MRSYRIRVGPISKGHCSYTETFRYTENIGIMDHVRMKVETEVM